MRRPAIIVLFVLATLTGLMATTVPATAQDFPDEPVGHVNDFANLLSASETERLETKLRAYRDSTSNVFAIATLTSLQGVSREEVATTIFNRWRMWEGNRQNGVLILVAQTERETKIEVGYGLEGAIPDIMAGRIVDEILLPNFQNSDFYGGLDEATSAMMSLAAGEYDAVDRYGDDSSVIEFFFFLFLLIVIAFILIALARLNSGGKGGRKRTLGTGGVIIWGGGGFRGGGGSGGFGSGGFGGGGGGFGGFGGGGGFGSGGGGAGGGW